MALMTFTSAARTILAAAMCAASGASAWAEDGERLLAYPEGYRDWRHMKTEFWGEDHALYDAVGGLHHIYANDMAVEGFRRGAYEDGAAFAFDLFAVSEEAGAMTESERRAVFIMVRDEAAFQETGGWGYEGYGGGDRTTRLVGDQAVAMCHACHAPKAESAYVFEDGFRD